MRLSQKITLARFACLCLVNAKIVDTVLASEIKLRILGFQQSCDQN